MNTFIFSGRFKKVWHEEGQNMRISVSVRRDYKNKDGKYEYDNIPLSVPKFNEGTIKYLSTYAKDGDTVEGTAHYNSYTIEKDGNKEYKGDLTVDSIRILHSGAGETTQESTDSKPDKESSVTDYGFIEIDDEDVPF